jgi:hypothetical protein
MPSLILQVQMIQEMKVSKITAAGTILITQMKIMTHVLW